MITKKQRVIHLVDATEFYGAPAMVLELAREQTTAGLDAEVYFLANTSESIDLLQRYSTQKVSTQPFWVTRRNVFRKLSELRELASTTQANVFHAHNVKGNVLLALLGAGSGFVRVSTHHGYTQSARSVRHSLYYRTNELALHRLEAMVAVSEQSLQQLPERFARRAIIHNGLRATSDLTSSRSNTNENQVFTIGTLGRLSVEKNYVLLLESVALLRDLGVKFQLLIAGSGREIESLKKKASKLLLEPYVMFVGHIRETERFIQRLDCYVNCSVSEGMPMTILEALRQGCPMVVSDIPANLQVVNNGELALTFHSGNAHALMRALYAINQLDSDKITQLKKRQRAHFRENYSSAKMNKEYMEFYERTIQHAKRA